MIEPVGPDPYESAGYGGYQPQRRDPGPDSRASRRPVRQPIQPAQPLQPPTDIGPRHVSGGAPLRSSRRTRRRAGSTPRQPVSAGRAAFGAVVEVVVVLSMALVLSLLIKTFLVQAFFIPSQSMETTLLVGDRVLVSKLTPGPFDLHHGDVIVFKDPGGWLNSTEPPPDSPLQAALREGLTFVGLLPQDSGEHLIKRLIGLPGDTVQCCDAKGRVSVNGVSIDETPYLYAGDEPSGTPFAVTVPAGKLWVMGDHRGLSDDSRMHQQLQGGFVPVDDVVGKAFVIVWPFNRAAGLGVPEQVFADVPERKQP